MRLQLFQEIVANLLRQESGAWGDGKEIQMGKIVEMECYLALQKIQAVLEDDCLEEEACFQKIEDIVAVFEALGSGCGNRHDFG